MRGTARFSVCTSICVEVAGREDRRPVARARVVLRRQERVLPLEADAEIDRQLARGAPAVLQVPRVDVVVVGRNDRRVVEPDLRRRVRDAADRIGVQDAVAGQVVRIPVGALIEVDADAGLELVLAGKRALREEADAVVGLKAIAGLVLMERRRARVQRRREILPRRRVGARVRAGRIVVGHIAAVAGDGVHEQPRIDHALELDLLNRGRVLVVPRRLERREPIGVVLRLRLGAALPRVDEAIVLGELVGQLRGHLRERGLDVGERVVGRQVLAVGARRRDANPSRPSFLVCRPYAP